MQSNQTKLLMAGLVAAQTVTALEIKETGLVQTQEAAHTMLAQIEGDELPEDQQAPSNDNTSGGASTPSVIETDSEGETIELMTKANLAGLADKADFIIKKVEYFRQHQVKVFCDIEEQCREKVIAQKLKSKAALEENQRTANAEAKLCRTDFIDTLLKDKEIVKGDIEELLNEAIHKIKELKVNGIFQEAGMPAEKHASVIETDIAAILTAFNTAVDELYTNATVPMGFTDELTAALALFNATAGTFGNGSGSTCLDMVWTDFT